MVKRLSLKRIRSLRKRTRRRTSKDRGGVRAPPLTFMNIITERHKCPTEIVSSTESQSNVKDEVNRRTCKAGYTTRDGHSVHGTKIQNRGYGESKLNVWPRDENGNLQGD